MDDDAWSTNVAVDATVEAAAAAAPVKMNTRDVVRLVITCNKANDS